MRTVTVIGDGNLEKGSTTYQVAYQVGRLIAKKGLVLISGGMFGVMEAACKGAKEVGGITVGILPDYSYNSNDFVDIKIPTGLGHGRNVIVAASSPLIIAIGGNYGTLSEIAFALKLKKKVIGFKTWKVEGLEYYEEVEPFLSSVSNHINLL